MSPRLSRAFSLRRFLRGMSAACLLLWAVDLSASDRLRIIVETDAGGDPDDEQSLVRLLVYANEFDIEGIIANRAVTREGENKNRERTGLGIVRALLKAYGECWTNLVQHDPRFPTMETLWARTVPGYDDVEDGVNLICRAVDSPDPRPVWFLNWGTDRGSAASCLKRALDRVRAERGPDGYAKFKQRLRLSSADKFEEHTAILDPPFPLWVDTFRPEWEGKRWYHRFSALTATAGGFDVVRDVLTGHGPLGTLYPTNTTHWCKEGDTPTFLYLVPTGMNDPNEPAWGSWAGRYGPNEQFPGKPYFWANQADTWNGRIHRDHTLARWAVDLQNDFRARMDWCVFPKNQANHPPVVRLRGERFRQVRPSERVLLDVRDSSDPDGDAMNYAWWVYPEPSSYRGELTLHEADSSVASLIAPTVASPQTVHLIVTVRDQGTPALARYARVVLTISP